MIIDNGVKQFTHLAVCAPILSLWQFTLDTVSWGLKNNVSMTRMMIRVRDRFCLMFYIPL